jgi:tRNA A-37 threonylcarbamoyl transferase component Bud32
MVDQEGEPDTLVRGRIETTSEKDFVVEETAVHDVYAYGEVIGRGGMGEVLLAHDRRIGRDVAIKRLRAADVSEEDRARFLREARIQARLDHPAVVPVYELARDEGGRPYFTMKRLAGVTLTEMIANPTVTRQRLLRAFADVCRAVDFAHMRGVVHRDLKPANISLGEFGEVYVLDWGVARVVGDAATQVVTADIDTLEGAAPAEKVLGTPGYMAPEQLASPEVERPADVYALGAILFELLAGEALHPRATSQVAIASTLAEDTNLSPAKRRPERTIPPELDALCAQMLARDPAVRPTARRVADRIEDYLDGDRDIARRKTMATDLVWSARAALDEGRRSDAMRAAGRALALDPEATGAAELVSTLMLQPPTEPPPELRAALAEADNEVVRRRARVGVIAYLALASFLPIAYLNGIRKWPEVLAVFGISLLLAFAALRLRKQPARSLAEMMGYAIGNAVLLVMLSRMAGPFTYVPALACYMTISIMAYPPFAMRPVALIVTILAGVLLPIVLEITGTIEQTWELANGALISHAGALDLQGSASMAMIVGATVVTIAIAGVHAAVTAKAYRGAQRQLVTQAWHLRQLLPSAG